MDSILEQQPQPTRSIADMLPKRVFKKVKQGNPRSEMIQRMGTALNIEPRYFKGLVFQTQNKISEQEMEFIFTKALSFKPNPAAYFRVLIKKKLQELKSVV